MHAVPNADIGFGKMAESSTSVSSPACTSSPSASTGIHAALCAASLPPHRHMPTMPSVTSATFHRQYVVQMTDVAVPVGMPRWCMCST